MKQLPLDERDTLVITIDPIYIIIVTFRGKSTSTIPAFTIELYINNSKNNDSYKIEKNHVYYPVKSVAISSRVAKSFMDFQDLFGSFLTDLMKDYFDNHTIINNTVIRTIRLPADSYIAKEEKRLCKLTQEKFINDVFNKLEKSFTYRLITEGI